MTQNDETDSGKDSIVDIEQLIEEIAENRISALEVLSGPQSYNDGDYLGFVNSFRISLVLMKDERVLLRVLEETKARLEELAPTSANTNDLDASVRRKDGSRLVSKLSNLQKESFAENPSLLQGSTFEECLEQHQQLIAHVGNQWRTACKMFRAENFPLCAFLAIVAIEEIGKLGRLMFDLVAWDQPKDYSSGVLGEIGRDHRKKHFVGVMSGAVVNTRVDRILGHSHVKKLLQDAESGKLEKLRQACLYIDEERGNLTFPENRIDESEARFLVVLAGELWAEVLGHVPWDFEQMLVEVIDFEIEIGFDEKVVKRQ